MVSHLPLTFRTPPVSPPRPSYLTEIEMRRVYSLEFRPHLMDSGLADPLLGSPGVLGASERSFYLNQLFTTGVAIITCSGSFSFFTFISWLTDGIEVIRDFSDLSWFGNITGVRNGDIEVTWAGRMVLMVGPQAIYVVGCDDDDDSAGGGSEVSDDAASWEIMEGEDNEMENLQKELEDLRMQNRPEMSVITVMQTAESIQTDNSGGDNVVGIGPKVGC
ncbi:hypothetical protein Lser_V15G43746 [Lactuca serriola]